MKAGAQKKVAGPYRWKQKAGVHFGRRPDTGKLVVQIPRTTEKPQLSYVVSHIKSQRSKSPQTLDTAGAPPTVSCVRFTWKGRLKSIFLNGGKCRPQGGPPTASPTERGAVGKEKHGRVERAPAREAKKERHAFSVSFFFGAGNQTRTDDLLITNQLLYRLSYSSIHFHLSRSHRRQGDLDSASTIPHLPPAVKSVSQSRAFFVCRITIHFGQVKKKDEG